MHTQRSLNIRFRAMPASSECEGRDKQPNSKQTKHRHKAAPPRNPGCVVLSTQRLSTQLNTQARSTLKIGTGLSTHLYTAQHRPITQASQHLSTHLNTAQHSSTPLNTSQHSSTPLNTSQHISTQLNTSQHISTHLYTAQHSSTPLNTSQHLSTPLNTSQHLSTHLNTSQHTGL